MSASLVKGEWSSTGARRTLNANSARGKILCAVSTGPNQRALSGSSAEWGLFKNGFGSTANFDSCKSIISKGRYLSWLFPTFNWRKFLSCPIWGGRSVRLFPPAKTSKTTRQESNESQGRQNACMIKARVNQDLRKLKTASASRLNSSFGRDAIMLLARYRCISSSRAPRCPPPKISDLDERDTVLRSARSSDSRSG